MLDNPEGRSPQEFRPPWFRGELVRRVILGDPVHYWRIGKSEYYSWTINNHAEAEGNVA